MHRPFERAADRRRRAGRKKKGCTERANEKERTAPLPPAPPAPSGTAPPPSRLVAAYHTSVKRHSTPAMKSPIYVYIYIYMLAIVRSPIRIVHLCARTEEEEKDGRTIRVLVWHGPYAHTGELFIPTGRRLPLRRLPDPIVRPIFGTTDRTYTFVFSSFFCWFFVSFFFFPENPSYRSFYGSIFISFFFLVLVLVWRGEIGGFFFFFDFSSSRFSFFFFLWTLFFLRRIKHVDARFDRDSFIFFFFFFEKTRDVLNCIFQSNQIEI